MVQPPILPPRGPITSDTLKADSGPAAAAQVDSGAMKCSPEAKPLEGKTTFDDKLNLECEILCYRAMSKIASKIAEEFHAKVFRKTPTRIIFLDESFKAALQIQQAFLLQADVVIREYQSLKHAAETGIKQMEKDKAPKPSFKAVMQPAMIPAATTIPATTAVGRSVIDLLALFRTDVSYSGRTVAIKEPALALELADRLRNEQTTFLYPRLLLYEPSELTQPAGKHLADSLQALLDTRGAAHDAMRAFAAAVAKRENELAELLSEPVTKDSHSENLGNSSGGKISQLKAELIPKRLEVAAQRERIATLDTQLKSLQDSLRTPDVRTGVVPLQSLQLAGELLARFKDSSHETFFLWAEVSSAGGSYQISRNLFRTLFWSDGLRYSGGAIVTFAFFNGNAEVVLSGVHRYREPFTRFPGISGRNTEGNSF